ncbi:hypothetical protein SteCoe_24137 [Stentor coeruleus]|uniref:Uncharacterized protein n=1 Tax=Stentor coeruleus TaxID=5963 RepID=A0A1R2BIA9_9CILI|nr:hypothetical protein SteCoe_24137 [Stentor coeruleus]
MDDFNCFKVPNTKKSILDVRFKDNAIELIENSNEPSAVYKVNSVEKVDPGIKYLVQKSKIFITSIDDDLKMTVKYRGREVKYNLLQSIYRIGPSMDINIVSLENTSFRINLGYDDFWKIDPNTADLYKYVKNFITLENRTVIENSFPLILRFGDAKVIISIIS